jgi:hypothetical protein
MIGEDDGHFLHVYGYIEKPHSEAITVWSGESGEKDPSTWPPMRWQHICITYNNKTGIKIPSLEFRVLLPLKEYF